MKKGAILSKISAHGWKGVERSGERSEKEWKGGVKGGVKRSEKRSDFK